MGMGVAQRCAVGRVVIAKGCTPGCAVGSGRAARHCGRRRDWLRGRVDAAARSGDRRSRAELAALQWTDVVDGVLTGGDSRRPGHRSDHIDVLVLFENTSIALSNALAAEHDWSGVFFADVGNDLAHFGCGKRDGWRNGPVPPSSTPIR